MGQIAFDQGNFVIRKLEKHMPEPLLIKLEQMTNDRQFALEALFNLENVVFAYDGDGL